MNPLLRGGVTPSFVEFSTFLRKIPEHFSNGDREVKDQIKTRRGFFLQLVGRSVKIFLGGKKFRWAEN